MDKYEITNRIEKFAPLETQEKWDCSGWLVETSKKDVNKIMLALTVTDDIIKQAKENNCDMIISHHPLFTVPISYKNIDIYCAHTNMDLAQGGTTDCLIKELGFVPSLSEGFLRYVDIEISLDDLLLRLRKISPNLRFVKKSDRFKRLAFCAGSGSEFMSEAYLNGADAFITGDLKFHTAVESPITLFDIGHFESEIFVLKVFGTLVGSNIIYSEEQSPFRY